MPGAIFLLAFFCLFSANISAAVLLRTDARAVEINPASLEIVLQRTGKANLFLSLASTNLGRAEKVEADSRRAKWQLPDRQVSVDVRLSESNLLVHVVSEQQGDFAFPVVQDAAARGWILPMFEGVYAPAKDARWISFLTNRGEMNTTADFGLPFLALDRGDETLTYILTNPFNNSIVFQAVENLLQAKLTHEFTRNQAVKEYAVLIQWGAGSPIEPAKIYRQWLVERGDFLSLKEKIQKTPQAEKLSGAIHAYVWGDELITADDIKDWKGFARELLAHTAGTNDSTARRIWGLLPPTSREAVTNLVKTEWPEKFAKSTVLEGLNPLLLRKDFFNETAWLSATQSNAALQLTKADFAKLSPSEVVRFNSTLFATAFSNYVVAPDTWGNGVSPKMVRQLVEAGIDRCSLTTSGWEGLESRPDTVAVARKAGFLIGTYDSYHSIHHPKEADTWATAQFDLELYQNGGIVNADGSKRHGFKKKGYTLSPAAVRPYVEKRVARLMNIFPANAWFMDCDGFGEFFDDYSPNHPATQLSDMLERLSRMAWITDTYGAVMGTEGCSAGVASTVHFAHGVMTPVIGWGDEDLQKNPQSKFFLGRYYPPDEPQIFFKSVPTKDAYSYIYFDPRFRLPLFQTVFHDSVVATHHWTFGSLKTSDHAKTIELLELLYNVPPLYHLNIAEFQKRKAAIKRHFDFFSPLHRELALQPMTDFKWLNAGRTIQQTTFGHGVDLIANFSEQDFQFENMTVAKRSVLAKWRKDGKTRAYIP